MYFEENYVRTAIDRAGGPTKTANALKVSSAAVHKWIRARVVPDLDMAKALSRISKVQLQKLRPTL